MGFTKLFNASSTNYIGWPAGSPLPVPAIQISGTSYFDSLPWVELLLEVLGTLPIEVICIVLPVSLFQNADGPVARYEVAQASNVAVAGITNVGTNILVYLANTTNTIPGTNDSNPLANNMVVYADNLGNRKTATTTVECAYPIHSTQYMSSKGYQLDPSGVNPGGTKTIWFNGVVDPNHPIFDSSAMALVSDIPPFTSDTAPATNKLVVYADGSGNRKSPNAPASSDYPIRATPYMQAGGLLMDDYATNPSGVGTNSIWYSSAIDAYRPLFNASRLALFTDIPSLTTDTAPVADNLVVYADSSGNRKVAGGSGAISSLNSVLALTSANLATVLTAQSANLLPTIKISSTNTTSNRGSVGFGVSNIGTWEIGSGSSTTLNDFYIYSQTKANIMTVNGTDGLMRATFGYYTTRYDVTGVAANPGSTNTIWADSVNSNSLRYGAGNVLVNPAPTSSNAIPVYTGVAGKVNTTATTTAATLARPITISAGATTVAATFNTTDPNCFVNISTTGTTTNRGAVTFGRSAVGQWTIGSDRSNTNADNFFIFRSGNQSLVINGSDQIVTANYGFNSARYDITSFASNPGGANTLWLNSAESTSPSWAGAGRLALASELKTDTNPIANNLVIYTDSSANRGTASGGGVVSCANPIGTPAIALFDPGYVADPASSYAGSIWMKTSTDPNRPQFKSGGPMALLSDVTAPQNWTINATPTLKPWATAPSLTLYVTKIGKMVTILIPKYVASVTTAQIVMFPTGTLPAAVIPATNDIYQTCMVYNNAANTVAYAVVGKSGSDTFSIGPTGGYTTGANGGLLQTAISYLMP